MNDLPFDRQNTDAKNAPKQSGRTVVNPRVCAESVNSFVIFEWYS